MYIAQRKLFLNLILIASLSFTTSGMAQSGRDYVYVVGSSTVYPFATVVAERFGRGSEFKTPKIESTGSGGGLKLSGRDDEDVLVVALAARSVQALGEVAV